MLYRLKTMEIRRQPLARDEHLAKCPDVRFGSKADIGARLAHVRFTPESGHRSADDERLEGL